MFLNVIYYWFVQLVIQKEIDAGVVVEQTLTVTFIEANQFCDDCHRVEAKDYWKATIQVSIIR